MAQYSLLLTSHPVPSSHPPGDSKLTSPNGWTDQLPPSQKAIAYKILRCPSIRLKPLVILSDSIRLRGVHWVGGRSAPCEGTQQCPNCEEKQPENTATTFCRDCQSCPNCQKQQPQFKGYIAIYDPNTGEKSVLELTPPTFDTLGAYRVLHHTLRGAQITLKRAGIKPNGRMSAEIQPSAIPASQLPEAFDVEPVMDLLWARPNNPKNKGMTTPRDAIGGQTAAESLLADLVKRGIIDADGNPIKSTTPTKTSEKKPAEKKPLTPEEIEKRDAFLATVAARKKNRTQEESGEKAPPINRVYQTTDQQKEMLERNKLATANRNGSK